MKMKLSEVIALLRRVVNKMHDPILNRHGSSETIQVEFTERGPVAGSERVTVRTVTKRVTITVETITS